MTRIVVSGARGFLGWHTRVRARALTGRTPEAIQLGTGFNSDVARSAVDNASHLIHIAGVNRGTDAEVWEGNVMAAQRIATALRTARVAPPTVTFANSVQVGNGSVYAAAKQEAANILGSACHDLGIRFRNVLLPNLFGEHGAPFYNSVVSTFCHLAASAQSISVEQDRELTLLHAQAASAILLDVNGSTVPGIGEGAHRRTVSQVKDAIEAFAADYRVGDIPALPDTFSVELFNTYRSFTIDTHTPIQLTQRSDDRGTLAETVRVRGGESHTFFSTTGSGITRGQHYHMRKIERFVVLEGSAEISLRRILTDNVRTFRVTGEHPVAIDMPTLWAHKITNTADSKLLTQFWSNEIFDPEDADTYPEEV